MVNEFCHSQADTLEVIFANKKIYSASLLLRLRNRTLELTRITAFEGCHCTGNICKVYVVKRCVSISMEAFCRLKVLQQFGNKCPSQAAFSHSTVVLFIWYKTKLTALLKINGCSQKLQAITKTTFYQRYRALEHEQLLLRR